LIADAAAWATKLNEHGKAIEFLEAGRSVFWAQAVRLHTPLDSHRSADPELTKRFLEISKELEVGSYRDVSDLGMLPPDNKAHTTLDAEDRHYRELNSAWVQALENARKLPGLEGLLRPKELQELKMSARNGPVVSLNAHGFGCTALILDPTGNVQCVNLPHMSWHGAHYLVDLFRAVVRGSELQINKLLRTPPPSISLDLLQDRLQGNIEDSHLLNPDFIFGALLMVLWNSLVKPIFREMGLKAREQ
jgi:hypothetical protein